MVPQHSSTKGNTFLDMPYHSALETFQVRVNEDKTSSAHLRNRTNAHSQVTFLCNRTERPTCVPASSTNKVGNWQKSVWTRTVKLAVPGR